MAGRRYNIEILGASGTGMAQCSTPFMRYGTSMEIYGDYIDVGVVMGIGTDTIPNNFIKYIR